MMGNILGAAPEYLGWERWLLGWVDDDKVLCAAHVTRPRHSRRSRRPAAPSSSSCRPASRRRSPSRAATRSANDHALPNEGLLVYFIDTSIATGQGIIKVLPIDNADLHKLAGPLTVTQSLTYAGVTVTFTSQDTAGDHFDVTY